MKNTAFSLMTALLAVMNESEPKDPYYVLAQYFLYHFDQLRDLNIYDVADACYVSRSGIRRFCQSIGFDNDGCALTIHVIMRGSGIAKGFETGRRNVVACHEPLGEILRTFQLGGRFGRAKDLQATLAKHIDDASSKRRLRTDYRQMDGILCGKVGQCMDVRNRQILEFRFAGGTGVTRCDIDFGDACSLRQLPGQRVFTAARADNENFHESYLY